MTVWFNGWLWGKSPGKHSRWFNEHPMNIPWNIKYHQISHEYTNVFQICSLSLLVTSCYIPIFPMNQRSRESFSDHRTQALAGRPNEGVAPDPPSPSWSGEPKGGCLGWEGSGTLETIGNAEMLSWYSLDWSYDLADFFRMPCWKCLISTSRFVRSLYTATNVVWQAAMSHSPGVVRTIGLWTEGNDHNQNKFHCSHLYYILYIYMLFLLFSNLDPCDSHVMIFDRTKVCPLLPCPRLPPGPLAWLCLASWLWGAGLDSCYSSENAQYDQLWNMTRPSFTHGSRVFPKQGHLCQIMPVCKSGKTW